MPSFLRLPSRLQVILWFTASAAVVGALYAHFHAVMEGDRLLSLSGVPRGAMTGAIIASILISFEISVVAEPLGARLRQARFLLHVAVKTFFYLIVILVALELGAWALPAAGERGVELRDVAFSLAASFVFVFLFDINRLLGQNVLLNFVTGRYHQPRLEERVFLFIDMEGSTGFAERLGPVAFHRLLNRFVVDLTGPIVAARGEVYRYVGDELIATWRLNEGTADARCVAACFAAMDRFALLASAYRREFGAAVNFRAGLHCGPVVTGEMGSVKKEIVFLGDTMNTAARIQEFCRQTGDRVLASADLLDRLALPPGVVKRPLGDLRLRGKESQVALYALTKTAPGRRQAREGSVAEA
ncbi:MAG TPA: adenylate/guanylate cyclase domain-containing protein [Roseiarcus sp.]|nr:adenylate/guanylate cyclase domain-containing protein [Roseiarcus sp.]